MDDQGQMLLLAALAVCVALLLLASFLTSIRETDTVENTCSGSNAMENVLWAQDGGLEQIAGTAGNDSWDRRLDLEAAFKNSSRRLIDGIALAVLARGMAFSCEYNDTLASQYLEKKGDASLTDYGGTIIRKSGNEARICGCAYDVSMTDEKAQYRLSRVVLWG